MQRRGWWHCRLPLPCGSVLPPRDTIGRNSTPSCKCPHGSVFGDGHKRSKLSLAVGWIRNFTFISPTKTRTSVGRKNTASHMKHVTQPKNECDRSSQIFYHGMQASSKLTRTSRLCHVRYVHKEANRSRLFGIESPTQKPFTLSLIHI